MHRPTIGVIALMLFAGALYYLSWPPPSEDGFQVGLQAAFNRLSIVMAALWLAHPQLRWFPFWMTMAVLAVIMAALLLSRPRIFLVAAPILMALWATRHWADPAE